MPKAADEASAMAHGEAALRALRKFLNSKDCVPNGEDGDDAFLRLVGAIGDFARYNRALPGPVSAALLELCDRAREGL